MARSFFDSSSAATMLATRASDQSDMQSVSAFGYLTIGLCAPLITLLFFGRSFVRIYYKRLWNTEDWLVTLAYIGTMVLIAMTAVCYKQGGGHHIWDLDEPHIVSVRYWAIVGFTEYAFAFAIIKVSILWLYHRVFGTHRRTRFDMACWALGIACIIFYVTTGLAKCFVCQPHEKIYNPSIKGVCHINLWAIFIADGIFNVITDIMILALPSSKLYNLQVSPKKRIMILFVFTFGLLAPVFSALGLWFRIEWGQAPDYTWDLPEIMNWTVAELSTGLMCACLPELGILTNPHRGRRGSNKGPSDSVLKGARDAFAKSHGQKSRRHIRDILSHSRGDGDVSTSEMGFRYIELEEESGQTTNIYSPPHGRGSERSSTEGIMVEHDIMVESSPPKKAYIPPRPNESSDTLVT